VRLIRQGEMSAYLDVLPKTRELDHNMNTIPPSIDTEG
jgi:hypothetical protein